MKAPRKETGQADAMMMLAEAMARGSTDGLVEEQEKRGQTSFVQSDTLPLNMGGPETLKVLEALGVEFHGVVEDDPLFQYVTLPDGWKKVATEHDMWSTLVDRYGKEVASIFYKAAFYDRSAMLHLR